MLIFGGATRPNFARNPPFTSYFSDEFYEKC
jgi:hypothetical protein